MSFLWQCLNLRSMVKGSSSHGICQSSIQQLFTFLSRANYIHLCESTFRYMRKASRISKVTTSYTDTFFFRSVWYPVSRVYNEVIRGHWSLWPVVHPAVRQSQVATPYTRADEFSIAVFKSTLYGLRFIFARYLSVEHSTVGYIFKPCKYIHLCARVPSNI